MNNTISLNINNIDELINQYNTNSKLYELQELCEREYQNPASGQARVREIQIEWTDAHSRGEISNDLLQGLDRRAFRLLRATSEEWLQWLDDIEFWKPGWRGDDGSPNDK